MPTWPLQSDLKAMRRVFGNPDANNDGAADPSWMRDHLTSIVPPYPLFYDGKPVKRITLNKAIAEPTLRALQRVAHDFPSLANRKQLGIDQFNGCFNFRKKRAGSSLSMHAYACALDFNAARNPFRSATTDMPPGFVDAFRAEGAEWGGSWSAASRDGMHLQFARTR